MKRQYVQNSLDHASLKALTFGEAKWLICGKDGPTVLVGHSFSAMDRYRSRRASDGRALRLMWRGAARRGWRARITHGGLCGRHISGRRRQVPIVFGRR